MSWSLLVVLAAVTIASRVLPMTLLPLPRGHRAALLDALPAPLFAALAAVSLVADGLPGVPVVAATLGALLGAIRRSLVVVLGCGIGGYMVATVVTG